jgi:hypothetical protein
MERDNAKVKPVGEKVMLIEGERELKMGEGQRGGRKKGRLGRVRKDSMCRNGK